MRAAAPSAPAGFAGHFLTGDDVPEAFLGASGPYRFVPAAVAVPSGPDDARRLVEWSRREGRPLVPRGGGTGMPGHNVGRGVIVAFGPRMGTVEPVDTEARTVRVGPAARASEVASAAAEVGLYFPPLPSSADSCTVGGMVANNAAGARSFLHGSVRDWIRELEVVLSDGRTVRLGPGLEAPEPLRELRSRLAEAGALSAGWPRVRKNSSGYALDRFLPEGDGAQLFIGSEGTLGLVTSVVLRLTDRPTRRAVALIGVPRLGDLEPFAEAAETLGAASCEYFGRRVLELARLDEDPEIGPLARTSRALLLVEFEGGADLVEEGVAGIREAATRCGTLCVEARATEDRERLWAIRHRASPLIDSAARRGLRSLQFIEDSVVPRNRLPDYVRALTEILEEESTEAVVFGHAGDGNLHVNPLVDTKHPAWRTRVRRILEETAGLVAELGGTLSGEHGDGRVRAPFLERVWGAELAGAFRRVKRTLDPEGLLNPGVIVPLPGQDPLEGLLGEPTTPMA